MTDNGAQPIQPSPVPLSWQFGKATTSEGIAVLVMILATPVGQTTLFLDRDSARMFFEQGTDAARSISASGLIIPHLTPPTDLS